MNSFLFWIGLDSTHPVPLKYDFLLRNVSLILLRTHAHTPRRIDVNYAFAINEILINPTFDFQIWNYLFKKAKEFTRNSHSPKRKNNILRCTHTQSLAKF